MRKKWTFERLQNETLKYKTRGEFQKNSKTAYNMALRKGYIDKICNHMEKYNIKGNNNPNFKWTDEMIELEALKYKTRSEFKKNNPSYQSAAKRNLLNKVCTHMGKAKNREWLTEEIIKEALKYKTRGEFRKNSSAYQIAKNRNILDQVCSHMENAYNFWTKEKLVQEALKYKTRSEFQKNSSAYQAAYKAGILDDICDHMESSKWIDEELAEEALKYKSRTEFQKNNNGAYSTAQHRGLLDKICEHAPKIKGTSLAQKEVANFIKIYCSDVIEETSKIIFPLELDIYIPSLNLAIEYCGLYWHSDKYKKNNFHSKKMKMCDKIGIRLITIFEDEWLDRQDQVKNVLLSVINKNKIKLMARKTNIREVNKKDATIFLKQNHIQGAAFFSIAFGLYFNDELQAVITGNKHHRQGHYNLFVLNRLAFKSGVSIVGGSSKLLKALLNYSKEKGYPKLISWSDNRWSQGSVYEKLGFILAKRLSPDYFYVHKQKRISKQSCKKKNLIKKGATGRNEKEMAKSLGLFRIYDCGKKRWEINL